MRQDEITRWRDAVFASRQIITNKGTTSYIEALDLDSLSHPPPERLPKPVRDLIVKIAEKRELDPDCIVRIVRVNWSGVETIVDDDIVQQVPEGQDMLAEVTEAFGLQCSTTSISFLLMAAVEIRLTY
ncbi:hypothetical protein UA08_09155 [Talaromyces atroroseus]|uniref:GRHL1/CP2 C-terminal domain-containing protein n=1 Tax=Talaromyces atroroseus TaxID=1441469 RepID=A0A1Q5Q6U9_TALAT|nr:hypothetical protein UA08_09155 [Talaromyces atroroseus]OKL55574.1 hypothetical protein UA08_09155 [Talaromyces atroroseus]